MLMLCLTLIREENQLRTTTTTNLSCDVFILFDMHIVLDVLIREMILMKMNGSSINQTWWNSDQQGTNSIHPMLSLTIGQRSILILSIVSVCFSLASMQTGNRFLTVRQKPI